MTKRSEKSENTHQRATDFENNGTADWREYWYKRSARCDFAQSFIVLPVPEGSALLNSTEKHEFAEFETFWKGRIRLQRMLRCSLRKTISCFSYIGAWSFSTSRKHALFGTAPMTWDIAALIGARVAARCLFLRGAAIQFIDASLTFSARLVR